MPGLPMKCQICGYEFESMLLGASPGSVMHFIGVSFVDTCPNCGGRAKNYHGKTRFQVDEQGNWLQIVEALTSATTATAQDFARLAALVSNAQQVGASPEDVADKIHASLPSFSKVAHVLVSADAQGLYTLLALILAFLAYFYPRQASSDPERVPATPVEQPTQEDVQRWISEALDNRESTEDRDRRIVGEAVREALGAQQRKRGRS